MKITSRTRIEDFVDLVMRERSARTIIDQWPLEPKDIVKVVVDHFRVLGIYSVEPMASARLIEERVVQVLNTSPELQELIRRQRNIQEQQNKKKALSE
jgi:hypothetical protein